MTIKIEREAVLCVLSGAPPAHHHPPSRYQDDLPSSKASSKVSYDEDGEEYVVYSPEHDAPVILSSWSSYSQQPPFVQNHNGSVGCLRDSNVSCTSEEDEDSLDDCLSVSSFCSGGSSSIGSCVSERQRRVSFASPLVTSVWTRPFTPKEEIGALFYSAEETSRFRQQYRLERKMLAQLDVDPATHPVNDEELSALVSGMQCQGFGSSASNRHRISRVVVMHNDTLRTFYDDDSAIKSLKGELRKESPSSGKSDDFFDNDSFWSGSITWY